MSIVPLRSVFDGGPEGPPPDPRDAEITRLRDVIAGMETRRVMDLAAKDEVIGELLEINDGLARMLSAMSATVQRLTR